VKAVEEFVIPFKGLSVGDHVFKFEIRNEFFKGFEYFENVSGQANIIVNLLKESNMLIFDFNITGELNLQCDRCLGFFNHKIDGQHKLFVKFGNEFLEESEDVIIIPVKENRIDLRQFIFEFISLLVPVKKVHPVDEFGESGCDTEIIDRINKYSKPKTDPRWDALKGIKLSKK